MKTVRLLRGAELELVESARFYESCSTGLGGAFVEEVARVLQAIADRPELGVRVGSMYRRFGLRRFPYSAIYRDGDDTIVCIAIAHDRREPGYWQRRRLQAP